MRRDAKVDANQPAVVVALRAVGASVQSLAQVGNGCPDLLVSHRGTLYLLEVKDGAKPKSARKLNAIQRQWHDGWRGTVYVVETPEQALAIIKGGV